MLALFSADGAHPDDKMIFIVAILRPRLSLMKPSGPKADLSCGRSRLPLVYNDYSVLVYGCLDKHNRTELNQ